MTPLSRAAALLVSLLVTIALTSGSAAAGPTAEPVGGEQLTGTGMVVNLEGDVPAPTVIPAASWVVADLDSGEVLAAQAPHQPHASASTLKVLTALSLLPELDPEGVYTATHEDAAVEGSKVGLVPDGQYTTEDLMTGLLLASGNDAANAMAELVGGMPAAAALMQQRADSLGAGDTVVNNTSGLDSPGQVTSAYDLALMARAALADPQIAEVVASLRYAFPAEGTGFGPERPRFEIQNRNRLMLNYDGAIGVKSGYTDAARFNFVGAAERDGRRYVVTVMRAEGSPWRSTASLLDWAYAHGQQVEPVGKLVDGSSDEPAATGDRSGNDGHGDDDSAPAGAAEPQGEDRQEAAGNPPTVALEPTTSTGYGMPTWLSVGLLLVALVLASVVALRVRTVRRRARRLDPARR